MVAYSAVQASNTGIGKAVGPSPTALFVGATEGIGYATVRAFVAKVEAPNIYIVGRSQEKGERVIEELKEVCYLALSLIYLCGMDCLKMPCFQFGARESVPAYHNRGLEHS